MYVRMYVCTYVSAYVCMCVRRYVRTYIYMYVYVCMYDMYGLHRDTLPVCVCVLIYSCRTHEPIETNLDMLMP
jgi:hypothetical protein